MALLKHPYELSVWDILPEEKKIAIIGSNTMTSPIRAIDPILVRNVNGTVTLTFKMYTRYFDEDKEQITENPFLSMLMVERALKLKYKGRWYDLVIKNRQESSDQKMYSYTAKSAHICELSKTGFDLEFKTELQNNQGTIIELGEKIMEDTDWEIGSSDIIRAYQDDQLILCQTSSEFFGVKMLSKTSASIGASKQFYTFYTDWKAFQEEEKELQILLVEYSEIADGKNLDDLILDGEYYDDNGILTIGDNVLVQYSTETKNKIVKIGTSNYRGRRLVKKQKTKFNATLDRYVDIYTSGKKNEDGTLKEDIEGYSKTEFLSPNFVENLIVNSKDFESTAGWYGKIENKKDDKGNTIQYQPTVELDYFPPISQETDWEKVAVTSRLKITPKATDIGNKIYNTGLRSNFSKIEDFAAGEQLLLCYNFVNENNEVLGKNELTDANVTFSIDGFRTSSFGKNDEIGEIERKDIPKQIFTAIDKVTKEDLKKAQFTITFNEAGPYYLKDISLFRYVKGDVTIITENEDGTKNENKYEDIIIYPGDVPDNKSIVTNFYYNVEENANNKAEEYAYLNSDETYTPIYNDANYEKIASIEKSESNRFNLIQELCETFECWADFVIEHDSNGKVLSKTICFKEYIGENRYTGFKYGINLKSIQRTIDSEQIATKIIVKPNSNEHGENGFCTIARATENPLGGTYLLNFDYYVNQGLLKKEDLDNDLYTKFIIYEYEYDEEGNIKLDEEGKPIKKEKYNKGFYDLMYEKSRRRDEIIVERTAFSASYLEGIAAKTVAEETLQATEQLLSDLKQQYKQYSGVEWPNISPKHREEEKADGKIVDNEIYKFIAKIQQAQSMRDDAEADAVKYEDYTKENHEAELKSYNERVQELKIEELEDDFFNKYHNFIQEGTWNSEEYWDDNEYYIDALDVARTSSRPKVTYTINVIDVSVLDDYEGYEFDVGDKTFMEDPEFFGYVFYEKDGEFYKKPYKEEVVITEISEHLEAPESNQIKVQNYKTQFDDLFQRITAQTQSLQYASGGYNRASAAINSDGTIDGELLQNSLLNYALALMNPENKGVIWDRDGIRIIDRENTNKILKLTGGAMQISNDGGNTWAIAVNGNGINAGLVTTGSINTEEIMIGNSQNFSFRWDVNGLNAYTKNEGINQDGSYNYGKFVRFDQYGLYGYSKGTIFNPSEGTTTLEEGLSKVKENADFGLTWNGFFLKSKHNDSSDLGFIEIDSENDFQVIGNDGKTTRVKIGLIETVYETSTDDEGNKIQTVKDRIYGLRLFDAKGKKVIDTLSDGSVDITGTITATGGNIGGWTINTGNLSSVQGEEGIILDAANSQIYSQKYFTSNSGNGWMINNDGAIFNNITLRGALKCAVLEYAEVSAVGGILMVRPATSIKKFSRIESEIKLDGGNPDEYSKTYTLLVVEVEDNKLFKTLDATKFPEIYAGDWCKLTTEADSDELKKKDNDPIPYSGINTNLFRCVWSEEEIKEEEDNKGNLIEVTHKYLGFDITSLTEEQINKLKSLNFEGLGIVNLGDDGSIGLALNSSDNISMVPKESFSVFTLETDSKWKYLKPHIILGKIPKDPIYDETLWEKYGLYADAVQLTGRITATSGYIGNATGGWIIGSNNISHSDNTLYLGTEGIPAEIGGISRSGLVFKAGEHFGVTKSGSLYASEAKITGEITATSGKIGSDTDITKRWQIGEKSIYNNCSSIDSTTNGTYLGVDGIRNYKNGIGTTITDGQLLNHTNTQYVRLIGSSLRIGEKFGTTETPYGSYGLSNLTEDWSNILKLYEVPSEWLPETTLELVTPAIYLKQNTGLLITYANSQFNGIVEENVTGFEMLEQFNRNFFLHMYRSSDSVIGNVIVLNGVLRCNAIKVTSKIDVESIVTDYVETYSIAVDHFNKGISLLADADDNGQVPNCFIEIYGGDGSDKYHPASPYIDFHYANDYDDYTSRIIENSSGTITIEDNLIIKQNLTVGNNITVKGSSIDYYNGSSANTKTMIAFMTGDGNGAGIRIGGGGVVIIGAGESAKNRFSSVSATSENTYLAADSSIYFYPSCQDATQSYIINKVDSDTNKLLFYPVSVNSQQSQIGTSSYRWTYGYFSSVYNSSGELTGSDRNLKNSIEPFSEQYTKLFDELRPVCYKYNDGTSNRYHTGFIAQEVESAIYASGLTTQDFAGFARDFSTETDPITEEKIYTETCYLRYGEFVALNTNEIQKLKKRVAELEAQLARLTAAT